jgi:hypothetical protein
MTPTINGVVDGGSFLPEIQAVSWVSIFGSGLAYVADPGVSGLTTEIANGFLPTSLKEVNRTPKFVIEGVEKSAKCFILSSGYLRVCNCIAG